MIITPDRLERVDSLFVDRPYWSAYAWHA